MTGAGKRQWKSSLWGHAPSRNSRFRIWRKSLFLPPPANAILRTSDRGWSFVLENRIARTWRILLLGLFQNVSFIVMGWRIESSRPAHVTE